MYAANFGHPDVIKLFIDNGANVNFQKGIDHNLIIVTGVRENKPYRFG